MSAGSWKGCTHCGEKRGEGSPRTAEGDLGASVGGVGHVAELANAHTGWLDTSGAGDERDERDELVGALQLG